MDILSIRHLPTLLLNFGSYSETCVSCFACSPKTNFNNLKVSLTFLPIKAEFDVGILSFLLLSGYDKTASGAAQTLYSQDITQKSHELQAYSKLAATFAVSVGRSSQ
jgi:hypothetical protein